jgi:micrococcal nuclease
VLLLTAAAGGCGPAPGAAAAARGQGSGASADPVTLVRIFDGDTYLVIWQGREEKVRLIGVDTPEPGRGGLPQAGAAAATASARGWLAGRRIALIFDPVNEANGHRDRFGRLLAYLEDDVGEDLGRALLEEGQARLFRKFPFARRAAYARVEAAARQAGRGLWAGGAAAELEALAGREGAAISLYPTGGDLWSVCLAQQARLEVRPGELPALLRRLRELQQAHQGARLRQALAGEGFQPAVEICPGP